MSNLRIKFKRLKKKEAALDAGICAIESEEVNRLQEQVFELQSRLRRASQPVQAFAGIRDNRFQRGIGVTHTINVRLQEIRLDLNFQDYREIVPSVIATDICKQAYDQLMREMLREISIASTMTGGERYGH